MCGCTMTHTPQYSAVSIFGYAALGDAAPGSIVVGFPNAPAWATLMANLMVVVHLVGSAVLHI